MTYLLLYLMYVKIIKWNNIKPTIHSSLQIAVRSVALNFRRLKSQYHVLRPAMIFDIYTYMYQQGRLCQVSDTLKVLYFVRKHTFTVVLFVYSHHADKLSEWSHASNSF